MGNLPRWIIGSTGAEEDTGEATHHIFELNPKTGVYSTVLQTFSLSYAHLILEALCWQEDLQRGLVVEPGTGKIPETKSNAKKSAPKSSVNSKRR